MKKIRLLLGKRIKELREKRHLTQQQLDEMVGIDQRNLSKIECGVTFPSRVLADIAKALEVSLPELFEFDHIDISSDQMKVSINDSVNKLNYEEMKIVYRLIKVLDA